MELMNTNWLLLRGVTKSQVLKWHILYFGTYRTTSEMDVTDAKNFTFHKGYKILSILIKKLQISCFQLYMYVCTLI